MTEPNQPTRVDAVNNVLVGITTILTGANVALPIVVTFIDSVTLLFKAVGVSGPSVKERAELIRAQVVDNRNYLAADIARLEALAGQD